MSREIKRVPLDFVWPVGLPWPGYTERRPCRACRACGNVRDCRSCDGAMVESIRTEPPKGPGYQLWRMTGDAGSPASGVFADREELLEWCSRHETFFARHGGTVEDWRRFANGEQCMMDIGTGKLEWDSPKP